MRSHRKGKPITSYRPWLERVEDRRLLLTITVNTAADEDDHANDTLSLREAIEVSNGELDVAKLSPQAQAQVDGPLSSPNPIDFNIPGTGPFTIALQNNLPPLVITQPAIIDGYSQPGASPNTLSQGDNAKLLIELSGANSVSDGLEVSAGDSRVSGLVINRFERAGIVIRAKGGNTITGNFIGTDVSGTIIPESGKYGPPFIDAGVLIECEGNTIGGTMPADRNLISTGKGGTGVDVSNGLVGDGVHYYSGGRSVIQGNLIGTDVTGTKVLGNGGLGISGTDFDTIGGTTAGAGNLISGNLGGGIATGSHAVIQGNFVGTDVTGSIVLGNATILSGGQGGIWAGPGSTIGGLNAGNVVAGCLNTAVYVTSTVGNSVTIQDNFIGTDVSGTKTLGNSTTGLYVFGGINQGGDVIVGNVISSNKGDGIDILGDMLNDVIQGNFIGTDPSGTVNLGNGKYGIRAEKGSAAYRGGPAHAVIGGWAAGARNVIAFNGAPGIAVYATDGIRISRNSIFSDSSSPAYKYGFGGIDVGHDLFVDGQAAPLLTFTPTGTGTGTLSGTLKAPANTKFDIEIFANDPVAPPLVYQGKTFITDVTVTTDPDGKASFSLPEPVGLYTASAIDPDGNTTKFSNVAGSPALTATTTTLSSSSNPAAAGTPVTFTATVTAGSAGGVPTGTVSFEEGATLLGTGTLDSDGIATFQTAALAAGSHTITAVYAGDSTFAPSTSHPLDQVVNSPTAPTADLTVGQTASSTTALVGANLVYTLTIKNLGPDTATSVVLNDALPVGTSFVSAAASQGGVERANGALTANLGGLAVGASATVTLVVRLDAAGGVTNTAQVTSHEDDPIPKNNTATLTTPVQSVPNNSPSPSTPPTPPAPNDDPATPTSPGDVPTPEVDGPTIIAIRRFGFHLHPTYLVVTFSRPLDSTSAIAPANYRIVSAGWDARLGDSDDVNIAVAGASYDPATATVTLRPQRSINLHHQFRLTIRGTGAGSVADPTGRLLDGNRDGHPGGDASTIVTWKNLVIRRPGGRGIIGLRTLRHLVWPNGC